MRRSVRSSQDGAAELAAALDSCTPPSTGKRELDRQLLAASALNPAVRAREAFRTALHDKLRREFTNGPQFLAVADQPDTGEVAIHTVEVLDSPLGHVVLADMETISPERAEAIKARLAEVVEVRNHAE